MGKFFVIFSIIIGIVIGILYFKITFKKGSQNFNIIKKFKEQVALGSDTESIIAAAKKLQKNSNYHAVYNIIISDTLEATKPAKYKRVERKFGSFERIDSFLDDLTPATRYIANEQGNFLCSFVQEETPLCYDISAKQKQAEQEKNSQDILSNWLKQGLIKAEIGSQKIIVNEEERICDQVVTTLVGKNFTQDKLGDITNLMIDKPTIEDLEKSKDILSQLEITSSNCYDRTVGLPLKTERTTVMKDQSQKASQELISLNQNPKFIEKLTAKTLITAETETFKNLEKAFLIGGTLYLIGEGGIYIVKDGRLIEHNKEIIRSTGNINALTQFGGKMYLGADRGLYRLIDGEWKVEIDMLKTFSVIDFIEFNSSLYVITGKGVFTLVKDKWVQPNSTFKETEGATGIKIVNGKLNVISQKGIFIFDGKNWTKIFSLYKYGKGKLFASEDRLFVATETAVLEISNNQSTRISDYKTTGDIFDVVSYKNNIFVGGWKGIFSDNEKYKMDEKIVGKARNFLIFQENLYVATDAGVYRLSDSGWNLLNNADMGVIDTLFDKDGVLYVGGMFGVYRFDGFDWINTPVTDVNKFYQVGNRLYVISSSKTFIFNNNIPYDSFKYCFGG